MSVAHSLDELKSPHNLRVQRRDWLLERIGWGAMAAVLSAALVGLLGPGPLSRRTLASSDGALRIQYDCIQRYQAPAQLRITVRPGGAADTPVRLAVSRSLLDRVTVDQIVPPPAAVEPAGRRFVYTFPSANQDAELSIVVRYQHDDQGPLAYEIGLAGQTMLQVRQMILP
jgi:hypothetical protein